jgi:hypothetical protein
MNAGQQDLAVESAVRFPPLKWARRRAAMSCLLIASSFLFAACENARVGPVAIQDDGGHLLVAVCDDITASRLWFDEKRADDGSSWTTFWKADVSLELVRGDVISTDERATPQGGDRDDPRLQPGDGIDIQVDGEPRQFAAQFTVPEGGMPDGKWLHPDGEFSAVPCD